MGGPTGPRKDAKALTHEQREELAARVARWLVRRGETVIDGLAVHQAHRVSGSRYVSAKEFRAVVRLLIARGLVQERPRRTGRRGRQPTPLLVCDLERLQARYPAKGAA